MARHSKKKARSNVGWCDGWGVDRHPTGRKLTSVSAWKGTPDETRLSLCPDCVEDFERNGTTDETRTH